MDKNRVINGVRLSKQEFRLYILLWSRTGRVVSYAKIYDSLLGDSTDPDRITMQQMTGRYIAKLRKKIGKEKIVSVSGSGYYLKE